MSMVAAYNELQFVCQKFVTLFVSLYGSNSQWIAMCIYARVMQEVCYSVCLNNPHFLCLVLQWNVSTDELMNFVMCDTLRFVTQLSFHSLQIFLCMSSSACLCSSLPIWHSTESTTSSTACAQFNSRKQWRQHPSTSGDTPCGNDKIHNS
jgi:hypothetical protein